MSGDGEPERDMPDPGPLSAFAESLAAIGQALEDLPTFAMAAGYRAKMIAEGFSPENAETMAVQFHGMMMLSAE